MRTRPTMLTILAMLVASLMIGVPGAGAAPPDHAHAEGIITAAERSAAVDHWTSQRRARAIPGEVRLVGRDAPPGDVERGVPTRVAPMQPLHHRPGHAGGPGGGNGGGDGGSATVGGATWTGGGLVATTTGKVFFTLDGVDYVCSGSVVNSSNDSAVLTAGHCLHDGGGGDFASNFVFIPGYDGDGGTQSGPFGIWAATSLHTTSQWALSGDFDYDVGFALMETRSEGAIAEVVGAQGIAFNQARNQHVYAFGFPHASPYDGSTLTYCAGNTVNDPYGASTQGVVCDMTGGSSGGPWYLDFDEATGQGTANSVNSYGYVRGPHTDKMFGPYFGNVAQSLYDVVEG